MVPGIIFDMARCTAPVRGHRSASAAADCPACGGRYGRYSGYSSYGSYSAPSYSSSVSSGGGRSSGGGSGSSARPRWSPAGSSVAYTPAEVRALTPVRESVEKRVPLPELRDCLSLPCVGRPGRGRQGTARSARVTRCLGLVQREGRRPRHTVASRNRQGTGEVASRDRAGDPCAAAPPPRRGYRRQRAIGTPSA